MMINDGGWWWQQSSCGWQHLKKSHGSKYMVWCTLMVLPLMYWKRSKIVDSNLDILEKASPRNRPVPNLRKKDKKGVLYLSRSNGISVNRLKKWQLVFGFITLLCRTLTSSSPWPRSKSPTKRLMIRPTGCLSSKRSDWCVALHVGSRKG